MYGEPVSWLVDTGCTVTLLSSSIYDRIPRGERPELEEYYGDLITGNGTAMDVEGQARMRLCMDGLELEHMVVVANTDGAGMLGLDFLLQHNATISVATGKVVLGQQVLKADCRTTQRTCSRVTVAETVVVPAGHRMLLPGRVSSPLAEGQWMVSPLSHTPGRKPLVVARSLVPGKGRCFPFEVMNPTEESVVLYKGTHAALVEPVEIAETKLGSPQKRPGPKGHMKRVEEVSLLPAELETMMKEIKTPYEEEVGEVIRQMLERRKGAFMLEGEPLGRTTLVEHGINTTTPIPLKQPARRFPIHQREEGEHQVQDM